MANFFAGGKGKKRIVLAIVAVLLIAVLIAGNIVLNNFAPLLHGVFSKESVTATTSEAKNALASADGVVRELAEESIVLLKNDEVDGKPFLPRDKSEKFNLFGWGSTDKGFLVVGGGSGGANINETNPTHLTLTEAFKAIDVAYNEDLTQKYSEYSNFDADYRSGGSTGANAVESLRNPPASFYTSELMDGAYNYSSTAVVTLSRWGCENGGTGELVNISGNNGGTGTFQDGAFLELTPEERAMFEELQKKNFNVIVLLNTTNPIELSFLEEYDCVKACLYVGIPGQSGAYAIPELLIGEQYTLTRNEETREVEKTELAGEISPSGRLSDTYAYSWQEHNPVYANALSSNSSIVYQEGIYFGYKWYETADAAGYFEAQGTSYDKVVQFPFGYGLSYTDFTQEIVKFGYHDGDNFVELENGADLVDGREYEVTVRVTNVGGYPGRDVVQLYYTAPYIEGGIEKASVNLLAFDKTAVLDPDIPEQKTQEVTLTFTAYDMASYDAYDKNGNGFRGYELDKGDYAVKLMQNAHTAWTAPEGSKFGSELGLYCEGIEIGQDPVTGATVENRFTDSTAYAGMPIDGSTGISGGVDYLSRANAFANFPTKRAGTPNSQAQSAAGFTYTGYDNEDVSSYQYEQDNDEYLLTVNGQKATLAQLNGGTTLTNNDELFKKLANWDDTAAWDKVLNSLSQNVIKDLIGKGGFQTVAIESIGKPRNQDSDGPAGFNSNVVNPDAHNEWTIFPAETLTGCSWSRRLTYNLGRAQGAVGVTTGRQGWYAPGVNLHRSVYNSRNYEYYSEDGVLSGKLAAETVRGAKENNLYCYVKHFVISDNGQNACDWYEWLTEQSLRENYLKAFEIVVKEGGANAMMSAFNKLGAVWCGYNHALLTDVLRTEWGFHGSVITDWDQGYMNTYGKAVKAGNDLWLNSTNGSATLDFSKAGEAYAARRSAKNILYTYVDTYAAALEYQEKVESGEYEDPYNVTLGTTTATAAAFSPLFVALWAIIDVVLVLGIGACVLFMFVPKAKKEEETAEE